MVTLRSRLEWYRKKSNYLGDKVDIEVINYKKYNSSSGTFEDSSTIIATITIYLATRGNKVLEQNEKWVIPDSSFDKYLDSPAYYVSYSVSRTLRNVVIFGRRWFRFRR